MPSTRGRETGNANDVAGGQNGTVVGNVTFGNGEVGQAFTFDGSNSYVKLPDNFVPFPTNNLPNSSRTTPITIDLWFKTTTGGVILGQQNTDPFTNPGAWAPAIYVGSDGLLRATAFNPAPVITSNTAVNDGQYHHLALTYDGTYQTLYLDGVAVGTTYAHQQEFFQ